jgi:tRNA(Arg) A34 adenosine deaminase TadA
VGSEDEAIDDAWQLALALAWHSYLAGTTPVGAVVVAPDGDVIAQGRGRRYEPPSSDQQLAHCHIAHAEINALAMLPPTRNYEDHTLLTTLEPCCMCLGAAVQSKISQIHYAGADPYAGASRIVIDTPQVRRRPIVMTGPLIDVRGRFAELIHVRWLLDFGASTPVLAEHEWSMPDLYHAAVRASTTELFRAFKQDSASVEEAIEETRDLLES